MCAFGAKRERNGFYNEGLSEGVAEKISVYLPEGLEFDEQNKTNTGNGWFTDGENKISTTITANKAIKPYSGNLNPDYIDVDLYLLVVKSNDDIEGEDFRLNMIAEIASQNPGDSDSTPGSVTSSIPEDYKDEEVLNSNSSSYIQGAEDDDDFESVSIQGKVKIEYNIKINKIDTDTKELLQGATFDLIKDEEIVATATTDENGVLDFGTLTTYGEGEDVYYIAETEAPAGYMPVEKNRIKITVIKTILDAEKGTYSVKVLCELLDYQVDTTRYEYTPVETVEQFMQIGTGNVVTIDGVEYHYNTDTNYKLMADLNLDGIQWTPINRNLKSIIDGNNHKISNLTITPSGELDISEIGLFGTFSGIIQNLELENVNINVNTFADGATSTSGYTGVGALVGVMDNGYIINCKVSGNVIAKENNVGGFIGHTAKGNMVKVQNSTNNATVVSTKIQVTRTINGVSQTTYVGGTNVGGAIGCALGAISVTDTINNGTVQGDTYNAGGLVGYAEATEYQDTNITADFDEGDKTIDLVVENKNTSGQYDMVLENIDGSTLGLIKGAVYKVLDENRQVISGLENVVLDEGHLRLATVDIQTLGVDTYYIQELAPAEGYDPLGTNIKLNIRRYWDGTEAKFKVSVEKDNVDYGDLENEQPGQTGNTLPSKTNQVFSKVIFENISWNSNKAEFKGCVNTGNVTCATTNAAGIIGNAHCIVTVDSCVNNGEISSVSKAGGIISELKTDELKTFSSFVNSENTGKVTSGSESSVYNTGSSGGIIAHAIAYIDVQKCTNRGEILAYGGQAASGIVADLMGELKAKDCTNYGTVYANGVNIGYPNVNSVAGGIVGKNVNTQYPQNVYTKDDNVLIIENCNNYANISASCHLGGIIGLSTACYIDVNNCEVKGLEEVDGEKQAISIIDESAGDKGGIIGNCSTESISVTNCTVDNVDLHRLNPIRNTYGGTAGIIGEICKYNGGTKYQTTIQNINISNCNVLNSKMKCYDKETAGIIGNIYGSGSITKTNINDCTVKKCEILNDNATSSYSSAAGILASSYEGGNFTIKDCIVDNCNVKTSIAENSNSGNDMNTAGIYGMAGQVSSVLIQDCDVINNTNIINNAAKRDSCANAAGIMCEIYPDSNGKFKILNCNVKDSNVTTTAGNLSGILSVINSFSGSNEFAIESCSLDKVDLTSETYQVACSSNSDTAGVIAYSSSPVSINDISITNSDVKGEGKNTAGVVGYCGGMLDINNILVEHTNVTSTVLQQGGYRTGDTVSAVVGGAGGRIIANKVVVDDANVIGENVANASGILGSTYSSEVSEFTDCIVKNSKIESKLDLGASNNGSNATSAGMIGRVNSARIDNCKVLDTDVTGKGNIVAGVIATTDNFTASNIEISDININAMPEAQVNQYSTRSVAGLIGSSTNTAKFKNITLTNIDIDSRIETIGGLIGYGSGFDLDGCTVDNLDIHYEKQDPSVPNFYGGIAGIGSSINRVDNTIRNVTVKNSSIEADGTKVAGLFGIIKSQAALDNCNVEKINLKNNGICLIYDLSNKCFYNGLTGGLVAYADSDIIINNSAINNLSITGKTEEAKDYQHVGGILGYSHGDSIFDNVNVVNTTINNNTANGMTGGMVGMTHHLNGETPIIKKLTISNSSVDGDTIINGTTHIGGILGFGKLIANSNNVKNTRITSTSSFGDAGGFIGNSLTGTVIDGGIVDNLNVNSADRAGGIVGFCLGNISNITMTNSSISTTSSYSQAGGIAGLINLPSIIISNCSLDNVIVQSVNGYVGGIAGFARNTINLCSVINSTITASGDTSNGAGGIVGFGDTGISITEHTIENNNITGANGVGDIMGAPTIVSYEQPDEEVSLMFENPEEDEPELNLSFNNEDVSLDESKKPSIKNESPADEEDGNQENTDTNKEETEDSETKELDEEIEETEEKIEEETEEQTEDKTDNSDNSEDNLVESTEEDKLEENQDDKIEDIEEESTSESNENTEQVTE